MSQYLLEQEINEFLTDLDKNDNGYMEYHEIEQKLDQVHAESHPNQNLTIFTMKIKKMQGTNFSEVWWEPNEIESRGTISPKLFEDGKYLLWIQTRGPKSIISSIWGQCLEVEDSGPIDLSGDLRFCSLL